MSFIECCKGQSAFGNACTAGANLKNHFLPLVPPVQTEKTAFGPLHRRFKHFQKRFGRRMDSHRNSLLALFLRRTHVGVNTFSKRQNETRDRDLGLRKTPSRRAKPIKIFWKRQNEAGNRSKSPKSHFLRRETGKILRKVISRGGKGEKCLGKRLRAAGRRLKVSEIGFVRWEKERTAYALRTFSNENDFAYPYK